MPDSWPWPDMNAALVARREIGVRAGRVGLTYPTTTATTAAATGPHAAKEKTGKCQCLDLLAGACRGAVSGS
jgi:hypothetical protein